MNDEVLIEIRGRYEAVREKHDQAIVEQSDKFDAKSAKQFYSLSQQLNDVVREYNAAFLERKDTLKGRFFEYHDTCMYVTGVGTSQDLIGRQHVTLSGPSYCFETSGEARVFETAEAGIIEISYPLGLNELTGDEFYTRALEGFKDWCVRFRELSGVDQ